MTAMVGGLHQKAFPGTHCGCRYGDDTNPVWRMTRILRAIERRFKRGRANEHG
jgi:hypothetical protein